MLDKEFKDSDIIDSLTQLRILRKRINPYVTFTLLYSGKKHGWNISEFHRLCDGKGPTVVLFQSSKGFKFGGFASIPWASSGCWKEDGETFVFSVDSRELVFKPTNYSESIFHYNTWGPNFGAENLGFHDCQMKGIDKGSCQINCKGYSNIGCDSEGNHVLTGDGNGKKDDEKTFTCTALEVYLVKKVYYLI